MPKIRDELQCPRILDEEEIKGLNLDECGAIKNKDVDHILDMLESLKVITQECNVAMGYDDIEHYIEHFFMAKKTKIKNISSDSYQILNNMLWLVWRLKIISNEKCPSFEAKDTWWRKYGKEEK